MFVAYVSDPDREVAPIPPQILKRAYITFVIILAALFVALVAVAIRAAL